MARTLVDLSNAYGDLGDPRKMANLLEGALEIIEKHFGEDHFQVAVTLTNLGAACGELSDHNKDLLEQALETGKTFRGESL